MSASTMVPTTTTTQSPTTWSLDAAHTRVGFAVKHLMISTVKGRFRDVSGSIALDASRSKPVVSIDLGANSITTGDGKRDAHLRSADFLNADEFPQLQFRAYRLEGDIDSKFLLHGDLQIRGVTRPVTLNVIHEGAVTDPWGNDRMGFSATTSFNRRDFGLEWNVALEAGGVVVGDEVRITIETELVRQTPVE